MLLNAEIDRLSPDSAVVTFLGSLTLGTSLKVADSQIQSAIADGVSRLVIDMSGVDFLDSAGLGMIVYVYGMLSEKGGVMRLCGVSPRIASVFKLTKTNAFLIVDDCRETSLSALN